MELTMTEFIVGVLSTNLVRYFSVAGFFFLIFYVLFKKNWVPKNSKSLTQKSRLLQRNRVFFVKLIYFYAGGTIGDSFTVRRI